MELGGKVNITCAKTGYNASVTFHTKPFYGGKLHRVTGEVKNTSSGKVICKVNGEWNGQIEMTFTSHQVCVIKPPREFGFHGSLYGILCQYGSTFLVLQVTFLYNFESWVKNWIYQNPIGCG